jgi:hypothetical protein
MPAGYDARELGRKFRQMKTPTKALMRMSFEERRDCGTCHKARESCDCGNVSRSHVWNPMEDGGFEDIDGGDGACVTIASWSRWISTFSKSRQGASRMRASFSIDTPMGEMKGSQEFLLKQTCSIGYSSGVDILRRKYASLIHASVDHPATDLRLVDDSPILDDLSETCLDGAMPTRTSSGSYRRSPTESLTPPLATNFPLGVTKNKHVRGPGAAAWSGAGVKSSPKTGPLFTCECGISFNHRGHYNAHYRSVHLRMRPFQCSMCTSSFAKRSDLTRHSKALHPTVETGINPACQAEDAFHPFHGYGGMTNGNT